ncbi:two-component histidine kinase [Aurantimicrobium minutum]|uniref:Two-component histidine kinase n=2 Tax=Aurantimicrobium minutum TaxID=708131 RepID=A0A173LVW0_9MICO|nr:two-component histidine kinase [Aurantimicrobium minutum]
MNLIIRCVVITAVYAAPALFFAEVVLKHTTNQTGFTLETIFYGLVLGAVLGWLMASSAGMRTARLEMLDEIKQINQELTWQNARIQSELWLDQKSLALTLHNDVQATLLAAALKLKAALDRGEKTANNSLPEIRELISRSINFGEYHSRNTTLDAVIERINNNWAGLITMDVAVSPETLRAIENDFVGLGVLEDVLSEFQNNSLKHGAATKTTAQLTMPDTGILHVVLANNGTPLSKENSSGLGSAFINSVALEYSLETVQGGVQLILQLPLEGK